MVICYRQKNGVVEKRIVHTRNGPHRGEERPPRHFSETVLKAYYSQELEHGSRFRSTYTKNQIKRAHDTAIARHEAGIT